MIPKSAGLRTFDCLLFSTPCTNIAREAAGAGCASKTATVPGKAILAIKIKNKQHSSLDVK